MKKYLVVVICVIMIMLTGCNVQQAEECQDDFVSVIYNKKPTKAPISIQYFLNGQNNIVTKSESVDYTDHTSVANLVLENANRYISTNIICHDCKIINGVIMINLSYNFLLLADIEKAVVLASLAITLKQYEKEYIMFYCDGVAVSFNNAPNVFLPPIRLNREISPQIICQYVANYNNMLNNDDDFVVPTIVWRDYEGVDIPSVENIPITNDFTASIIKYLFYNAEHSLVNYEVLLEVPKIENNIFVINAYNCSGLNTDIIIKNLRQFCGDIDVEINNYTGSKRENAVLGNKIVANIKSDDYGDFATIYYPEQDSIGSRESAIVVLNDNPYFSVAKYSLENAILNCSSAVLNKTLLYDVWLAEEGVFCISLSNYCTSLIKSLPISKQKQILYSVVNTLCFNFNVNEVRILIDGYTIENVGNVNTVFPLKAITK